MSLFYEDINNQDTVFIDTRENERGKRFKKYLDNYLDNNTKTELEELDVLKDKKDNDEEYCKITNLEYGDYAFDNICIEFKTYEDFKTSIRYGNLTTQIENLYAHSEFLDIALIVICDNPLHFFNEKSQWKGILRFNSKINVFLARDEKMAFECICHLFWLNGRHLTQPPRSKMRKSNNYAANLLWSTRTLSDKMIREIIKKTNITTMPQAIELFTTYTPEELSDKLKIRGLTVKRIENCRNIIQGKLLI